MSYEKSKLLSLLKKQDINSLFLEATNYLCQTKSLFEEKEQLQQENEQLKDNWNELKEFVLKKQAVLNNTEYTCYSNYSNVLDKMTELEQGSDSNVKD